MGWNGLLHQMAICRHDWDKIQNSEQLGLQGWELRLSKNKASRISGGGVRSVRRGRPGTRKAEHGRTWPNMAEPHRDHATIHHWDFLGSSPIHP